MSRSSSKLALNVFAMKILVVEDDALVAQTLQRLFTRYSYAVDIAGDAEVALQMLQTFSYHLIVLDVVLPKLDGISLCHKLRVQGIQSPILLLTGQGETRQKAIALDAGADDYVVKPFDIEELMARIQALLRRGDSVSQPILNWGHLSIDPSKRDITYGGQTLSLRPKVYAILELLLRNPQKAFSAKAILDHSWASVESPGEEVVRVHIKELRQQLQKVGAPKAFIKTIHRVGYQLNSLYADAGPESLPPEQETIVPQMAEFNALNEALLDIQQQLRATQSELYQKHQELEISQQALMQERQQWQALVDDLLAAIALGDDQSCFVNINPMIRQWLTPMVFSRLRESSHADSLFT
jgi:DNA-binding response OmpR family regulator